MNKCGLIVCLTALCAPPLQAQTITRPREVFDVTGAGDTVISTLALALAAGASMVEAAFLANAAASIVVGKLGTATVSLEELRRAALLP